METTRHFTATTFVVNDGATALHDHERLGITLPPGGHVDRDELPHEAALREVHEETGFEAELIADRADVDAPNSRALPEPAHLMLHDINVHPDGSVGHQHVDHLYFAHVPHRRIEPAGDDEATPDDWGWYTPDDLRASDLEPDVVALGREAIAVVDDAVSGAADGSD
ncbi:NUDIX domain-containing protein [Halorubrum sp. JWXQ-INN 858]|uniref:NUDIX hydrolase n=1 Tax=Halorubrum sp. JWXQ-INN 858 TaxID=2690782 RepID=UPI00135AAB14|nr:NUDIX domain-containing protein [Halorubrum sp. JWXQ-INN 858]MWV65791.1 NUDIX domain-containing protein [Halorubrum sp. JWXQ-INN 858]